MGLFSKKKKGIKKFELPDAPEAFPDLPSEEIEMSGLSSLPTLPKLPGMQPLKTLPQLEPVESKMPEHIQEFPELNTEIKPLKMEVARVKEPVFVKIDKFRDAMANFDLIKKKLNETSEMLEKIRETRRQEEEELNEWAEELNSVKQKIASIDKKIFSSLD